MIPAFPKPIRRRIRREETERHKKDLSAFPKPGRQRSKTFLKFVRTKRCAVCRSRDTEAHHLDTKGAGGSDFSCVPLCHDCHMAWHQLGDREFSDRFAVNLWRVSSHLVTEYFTR